MRAKMHQQPQCVGLLDVGVVGARAAVLRVDERAAAAWMGPVRAGGEIVVVGGGPGVRACAGVVHLILKGRRPF